MNYAAGVITACVPQPGPQLRHLPGSDAGPAGGALEDQMEDIERKAIQEALEKARFNKTKAAELLGMSFRSLRYRIKKLGIE